MNTMFWRSTKTWKPSGSKIPVRPAAVSATCIAIRKRQKGMTSRPFPCPGTFRYNLSEKPIADTMAACVRIYKKVQAAGRKMAVTMSHRFDQDKQSLERAIKSGEYGRLNYVVGRFTHNCRAYGSWSKFRHEIPDPL